MHCCLKFYFSLCFWWRYQSRHSCTIWRLAVKWHECHITSAETKLIIINNKSFSCFLPDGSVSCMRWRGFTSYVPYFDKTSDAMMVALPVTYFTTFFLPVARQQFVNIDVFPLIIPHRSSLPVGSFAQFTTSSLMFEVVCRRNWQSDPTWTQSVECDDTFYFLHELLRCCSSNYVWTRKIKGSFMKYSFFFPSRTSHMPVLECWRVIHWILCNTLLLFQKCPVIHSTQSVLKKKQWN